MNASKRSASARARLYPISLLRSILDAAPDKVRPIARIVGWQPSSDEERAAVGWESGMRIADCGLRNLEMRIQDAAGREDAEGGLRKSEVRKGQRIFRSAGSVWMVVFDAWEPFYAPDHFGARYAGNRLYHPNEPISSFELEVLIQPEKGEARAVNSIQPHNDAQCLRNYRRALELLRTKKEEAQSAGDLAVLEELEHEIGALESAVKEMHAFSDAGMRAYDNVRKAVLAFRAHLSKGGPGERALEEHLRRYLSIGLQCMYSPPDGQRWEE